jgi:hypothetical protein
MKRQVKHSEQQEAFQQQQQRAQSQKFREFASPEELLRHDALHTPVPPAIAQRLRESLGKVPVPPPPWWRRLFGSKD